MAGKLYTYFDRFDICEAYYLFCCNYHSGQNSPEYAALSALTGFFKPRAGLDFNALSINGQAIYDNLVDGHMSVRATR